MVVHVWNTSLPAYGADKIWKQMNPIGQSVASRWPVVRSSVLCGGERCRLLDSVKRSTLRLDQGRGGQLRALLHHAANGAALAADSDEVLE